MRFPFEEGQDVLVYVIAGTSVFRAGGLGGICSCGRVETISIRVDVDAYVVWGSWRSQGYGAGALIEVDLDTL